MFKNTMLIILVVSLLSACATDPVSSSVSTALITNQIKDTTDKLTASVDRATINSDYLLEKNLRRLELVSHALTGRLEKEMGTNREFVSKELAEATTKFSELVDQAQGGVLEIKDFIALDIQRIINQIPLKKDEYLIRRVDGYGVEYRKSGAYEFRILGNAFSPGNNYKISIADKTIDPSNIYGGATANTLRFTVPVDIINGLFKKQTIQRIKLVVSSRESGSDKEFFNFKSHVLLLPTHPVAYKLTETKRTFRWSGENSSKVCRRDVGPSGSNGVWTQGSMSCTVNDPANQRFTRQISAITSGSHSRPDSASFNGNRTTATSICHNQCHDCPRTCTWNLGVESKVFYSGDEYIMLKPLSLNAMSPYNDNEKTYIAYGSYSANLSNDYETFTIAAEYFNGKQIVLHPQKLKEYGIRVSVDTDDTANSQFRRLVIEVKDAAFDA